MDQGLVNTDNVTILGDGTPGNPLIAVTLVPSPPLIGGVVIVSPGDAIRPLTLRRHSATQSANILALEDEFSNLMVSFDKEGRLTGQAGLGALYLRSGDPTRTVFINAEPGQIVDVFRVADPANNPYFSIHFNGTANLTNLQVFANNAAAAAGGLVAGDLYRTGADPDPVCIVH